MGLSKAGRPLTVNGIQLTPDWLTDPVLAQQQPKGSFTTSWILAAGIIVQVRSIPTPLTERHA